MLADVQVSNSARPSADRSLTVNQAAKLDTFPSKFLWSPRISTDVLHKTEVISKAEIDQHLEG